MLFPYDVTNVVVLPPGLTNIIAIAAGGFASAALREDGTFFIWPLPSASGKHYAAVQIPAQNAVQLAVGSQSATVLYSNGSATTFTPPDYVDEAAGEQWNLIRSDVQNVQAIAADRGHHSGRPFYWANGQLLTDYGGGLSVVSDAPILTPIPTNVVSLCIGAAYDLSNVTLSGAILVDTRPPHHLTTPQLSHPQRPGIFMFTSTTDVGRVYRMEKTMSLSPSVWTFVSLAVGIGDVQTFTDPASAPPQGYYRLSQW